MKISECIVLGHGHLIEVAEEDCNDKYSIHDDQIAFNDILTSIELDWIEDQRLIKVKRVVIFVD